MDWKAILQMISFILILFMTVCYAYQFVYLLIPLFSKEKKHKPEKLHRYAILIAARNEEKVLPHLLNSINAQDYPAELISVFVVADNCTDRTALVAQENGATVFPRFSSEHIGKGHALNYLIRKIDETEGLDNYDAFLIFDADNLLQSDYVRKINGVYSDGYEAFCGYRNTKNFGSSWVSAGYGVWYLHDSAHLNRSRMAIGASCMVNGTGFGFSREVLKKCGQWEFFTLTEDIEFSIWCASHGIKIGYCNDAVVYDEQPLTFSQSWRQRTRWAQGGIQIMFQRTKDLLRGMSKGKWEGYSCFEFTTLSSWGCVAGILIFLFTSVTLLLCYGLPAMLFSFLTAVIGSYLFFLAVGIYTVVSERHKMRCRTRHKVLAVFSFPLYMLSFVPIAICAPFRKFQWTPIEHTVSVSEKEMEHI